MSLEQTELKIGGTSFKGVYIAILFSLATTLGGGVWTASSLYARLEAVETVSIPNIVPLEEKLIVIEADLNSQISLIAQELKDNDVSQLQGKLAALGVNLVTIMDQQKSLLEIDENVTDLEKDIEAMRSTVKQAELIAASLSSVDERIKSIGREIEDLWEGMDYISNPLK
jgi:peptidoglycan hydrolase CwlO-like protein